MFPQRPDGCTCPTPEGPTCDKCRELAFEIIEAIDINSLPHAPDWQSDER